MNIDKITSMLRRLEPVNRPEAVQQYAQQHKDNYIIMSLAMSEANRRKDALAAKNLNIPPSPKVNDQAIQSMAAPMPEHVGIGQLPAQNIANMAGGGIVAFSDGGDVPRYQSQGLVQESVSPALRAQYEREATEMGFGQRMQFSPEVRQVVDRIKSEDQNAYMKNEQARMLRGPSLRQPALADAPPGAAQSAPPAASAADVAQAMDAGSFKRPPAPPPAAPKPDTGAKGPSQRTPPAGGPEPLGGPGASAQQAAGIDKLPRMPSPMDTYQSVREAVPLVDPTAGMREDLGKEMVSAPQERLRKRQEEIAAEGDVFAGRGERIGQREAKLKDYEGTNQSLAFINAGLAVMSTPGGLATAIGKGARVGTEQYAAGLDKIRAAQERLEDAKDNLDTLRLNRADMNKKDIRSLEADVDRAKLDSRKLGIEGIVLASDLREKQAGKVYDATMEQAKTVYTGAVDLQGRQIAANATMAAANAPGAQERMFSRLGGGDLRKGMQDYSDIMGPEAKGETAMLAAYAKDPVKLKLLEQTDPALAQLIKSRIQTMMVPGAQNAPGPGGARP